MIWWRRFVFRVPTSRLATRDSRHLISTPNRGQQACRDQGRRKKKEEGKQRSRRRMRVWQSGAETCGAKSSACRLCLRVENDLIGIFEEGESSRQLRCRILDCCPVTLTEDSRLPGAICRECEKRLAATHEFREQCRQSERALRVYLHVGARPASQPPPPTLLARKTPRSGNVERGKAEQNRCAGGIQASGQVSKTAEQLPVIEDKDSSIWELAIDRSSSAHRPATRNAARKSKAGYAQAEEEKQASWTRQRSVSVVNSRPQPQPQPQPQPARVSREKEKDAVESVESVESVDVEGPKGRLETGSTGEEDRDDVSLPALENPTKSNGNTEIRYLCDVCSKTFLSKSGLRFHLKSHNGVKAHACRYCGKRFAIPSYAKRHERIHAGEKRFVCQLCSAAFASANGLKYHARGHTGQANYSCHVCGKSFYRRKYLKEHAFTHTGEKPFACKSCAASYANSGSLFVHQKRCNGNAQIPALT